MIRICFCEAPSGCTVTPMGMGRELKRAAANLLQDAAGLSPGARLLIVSEPEDAGYYGPGLAIAVADAARALGYAVTVLERPFDPALTRTDPQTAEAMGQADLTLFAARMGDQVRFRPDDRDTSIAITYALDCDSFASPFGTISHHAMVALCGRIDAAHTAAGRIRITCPAGTDFAGHIPEDDDTRDTDALRFPLSVHTPVSCKFFSGRIAQRGFLVGTGSTFYTPYAIPIEGTLGVSVEEGRITGFEGPSATAARVHYLDIADRFGIDPWAIHSWHSGIHPACAFPDPAAASFERWSGTAFGNPRLLHFHTCGDYAPGEICLNILDPTVEADGVALKKDGRLTLTETEDTELAQALADPARACGEAPGGGLSFG